MRARLAPDRRPLYPRPRTRSRRKVRDAIFSRQFYLDFSSGKSALSLALARVPSGYSILFGTDRVFNLYTTPQANAGEKAHYWPRGERTRLLQSIVHETNSMPRKNARRL